MEVETTLAESIRTMDKSARYDAACKRLLAIKIILAWIMKSCLKEFKDIDVNEIKVYSIWIALKPPKERENTITRYRIVEENVVGEVREVVSHYDLMTVLMICLGAPEDTECDILKLLDILLSNKIEAAEKQQVLKNEFGIPMTKELEGGLNEMCNLSKVIEQESRAEGKAEGITIGETQKAQQIARNLYEMGIDIERIAQGVGYAIETVRQWLGL